MAVQFETGHARNLAAFQTHTSLNASSISVNHLAAPTKSSTIYAPPKNYLGGIRLGNEKEKFALQLY